METKTFPVGTKVRMINCSIAKLNIGRVWQVSSQAWTSNGEEYVRLEGRDGGFPVRYLEQVEV